jgi:hypothetical protein
MKRKYDVLHIIFVIFIFISVVLFLWYLCTGDAKGQEKTGKDTVIVVKQHLKNLEVSYRWWASQKDTLKMRMEQVDNILKEINSQYNHYNSLADSTVRVKK